MDALYHVGLNLIKSLLTPKQAFGSASYCSYIVRVQTLSVICRQTLVCMCTKAEGCMYIQYVCMYVCMYCSRGSSSCFMIALMMKLFLVDGCCFATTVEFQLILNCKQQS